MGEAKRRKIFDSNYGKTKVGDNYYDLKNKQDFDKALKNLKFEDIKGISFDPSPVLFHLPSEINYKFKQDFSKYLSLVFFNIVPVATPYLFHKQKFPNIIIIRKIKPGNLILSVSIIQRVDEIDGSDNLTQNFKKEIKYLYESNIENKGVILVYLDKDLTKVGLETVIVSYFNEERAKSAWDMNFEETRKRANSQSPQHV